MSPGALWMRNGRDQIGAFRPPDGLNPAIFQFIDKEGDPSYLNAVEPVLEPARGL